MYVYLHKKIIYIYIQYRADFALPRSGWIILCLGVFPLRSERGKVAVMSAGLGAGWVGTPGVDLPADWNDQLGPGRFVGKLPAVSSKILPGKFPTKATCNLESLSFSFFLYEKNQRFRRKCPRQGSARTSPRNSWRMPICRCVCHLVAWGAPSLVTLELEYSFKG